MSGANPPQVLGLARALGLFRIETAGAEVVLHSRPRHQWPSDQAQTGVNYLASSSGELSSRPCGQGTFEKIPSKAKIPSERFQLVCPRHELQSTSITPPAMGNEYPSL